MSAPRLKTEREMIRTLAARWKAQYRRADGTWGSLFDKRGSEAIYRALAALDPETATRADVAAIGMEHWVTFGCNGCGDNVSVAVEVGDERDYESRTAILCASCLAAASALLASPSGDTLR